MRRVGWMSWALGAMAGVACGGQDDVTSRQAAIEGSPCPEEWYAAVPPDPSWGFPATLGDMLPIDYIDGSVLSVMFAVPSAALAPVLPAGVAPLEVAPGVGAVIVAFNNFRELSDGIAPYRELTISIPVFDSSLFAGYLPEYDAWMVVTSEPMLWLGIEGWGFPKIMGNVHCNGSTLKNRFECVSTADDRMILKLEVSPDPAVAAAPALLLTFVLTKDGYLVRIPWNQDAETYTYGPGRATLKLGDHPIADQLRVLGLASAPAIGEYWTPHTNGQLVRGSCTPLP